MDPRVKQLTNQQSRNWRSGGRILVGPIIMSSGIHQHQFFLLLSFLFYPFFVGFKHEFYAFVL